MKKKTLVTWIVVILCLVLIVVLLQQCNHDDQTEFALADVSEITFEELLAPPYVTMDEWSFVDMWQLECNGEYSDPIIAEEDLYIEIAEGLRENLKGETLHTYIPEGKVRNYDKHVRELLWEHEGDYPLHLQLSAGILYSGVEVGEEDLVPTMVRLYSLDGSRCYLTIGYSKGTIMKRNHYVFYTDDPQVIGKLFDFAEAMIARKNTSGANSTASVEKEVLVGSIDYPYYSGIEDLAGNSDYIIHGKVIDKAYEWRVISTPAAELYLNPEDVPPTEEDLVTVYTIQVQNPYLPTAEAGDIIEVMMMGGETEGTIHTFEGTPELLIDDEYVFFLSESSLFENAGWPLNLNQSIYRVEGSRLHGGFPLTFDALENIQTAILDNEKTDAINFSGYANEELQVYYCDWNNVEDTRIRLSEAQTEELMGLLEPYGSTVSSDVVKSDFMKFYRIRFGTSMTVTVDAERGKYGDQGASYIFVMDETPGAFIRGTYINADLLNFLDEQLAEES